MVRINRKVLCAAAAVAIGLLRSVESQPQSANESDLNGNPSANDNPANVAAPRIEFEPFEDEVDPELEATDEVKVPPKKQELFDMDLMMSPLLSQMPKSFRRHYCYFLFYCVGMLVYGWIGYETNKQRVKRVIAALKPVLQENFAFIADEPHCYEALRWHKFQAYASGRTSCDRLFIDFDLIKRQCMWHRWVFRHMFRMEDTMTIEMMLPKMDCIVFAITHKMTNKLFIKKNQEVANTTYVLDSNELPPTHRAYINGTEKCFAKYASYVIAACQEFMPHLIHFYAADAVPEAEGYRQWRQIVLKVRVGDDDQLAAKVLAAAIHIADYTKNYTVMDKTREAMTKARQDMIAVLFKAEIKRQKEEAKEAKEESKLTPEKIKKLEKKALARPTPRVKTHTADVPEVADVEVPQALKENIEHLKQLHQRGCTINNNIEQSVEFKNPYLLEKVMKVFNIEGHCSNYSKHVYDPDYYVALARETEPETQQPRKDSQTCGHNAKAEAASAAEARGRPSGWSTD